MKVDPRNLMHAPEIIRVCEHLRDTTRIQALLYVLLMHAPTLQLLRFSANVITFIYWRSEGQAC